MKFLRRRRVPGDAPMMSRTTAIESLWSTPCGCDKEGQRLLHVYKRRGRGNSIRHDLESAKASLLSDGNVEVRRHQIVRCDRHAAVVVGAAVENVAGGGGGGAHPGTVR